MDKKTMEFFEAFKRLRVLHGEICNNREGECEGCPLYNASGADMCNCINDMEIYYAEKRRELK